MPYTHVGVPDRRARARRDPAALGLLVEGRDHLVGARRRRRARLHARSRSASSARCSPAPTPSGSTTSSSTASRPSSSSSTPAATARVTRTEPRARTGTTSTRTARGRSRCSSRSACSPSSRRSRGFLVIPGVWEPFLALDRRASPSRSSSPTVAQDYATSAIAVLARRDRHLARAARVPRRPRARRRTAAVRTILEHKLYFDELYDALFSRPVPARREPAPRRTSRSRSSRARSARSGTASARPAAGPPGSRPASCARTRS